MKKVIFSIGLLCSLSVNAQKYNTIRDLVEVSDKKFLEAFYVKDGDNHKFYGLEGAVNTWDYPFFSSYDEDTQRAFINKLLNYMKLSELELNSVKANERQPIYEYLDTRSDNDILKDIENNYGSFLLIPEVNDKRNDLNNMNSEYRFELISRLNNIIKLQHKQINQ